ncbi:MAG: DUF4157 domain-containing protein [Rhodanobacter sp.]
MSERSASRIIKPTAPTTRPALPERSNSGYASRPVAPPLVHQVLAASSRPLEPTIRHWMESRSHGDFSQVRVHDDGNANESALQLGAAAYTVGNHLVFGRGQYAPHSTGGQHLIAHELSHFMQDRGRHAQGPIEVGASGDRQEREAEIGADRLMTGSPLAAGFDPQPAGHEGQRVLRRSLLGGIVGGALGAAGGALIGGLLGGPIGAVVGGLVGLVGGALIGDSATTRKRSLTSGEVGYAKSVFHQSIDYSVITVTRDSMISTGAPKTIGNTIHLRSDWGHFVGDSLVLSPVGLETLIHEMGHVWQYQNGGLAYIPMSLWAQFKGWLGAGSRDAAYDWHDAHRAGRPWEAWNPEQQAAAIERYNKLLRKSKDGTATVAELAELSSLLPYMQKVWAGQGAPHFETPDLRKAPL